MSGLIAMGATLTMSSREIAELTRKRHDNVMPVCRSLRDSGVCPEIQETPFVNTQNGQTYMECMLNKRDSFVLIARLSPEFTARLVDRCDRSAPGQLPGADFRFCSKPQHLTDQAFVCTIHKMKSADLIKELKSAGWELDRVNGSHHVFRHPERPGHIVVPHPKKDLGIGLVKAIRKAAGI